MKWLVYGAVIAASLLVPLERTDVGKLQPIELVAIYTDKNQVVLKTELGDMGAGRNVQDALEDMKQTVSGIIYLDTAEYLVVGPGGETYINQIREYLKDNVRICRTEGDPDLQTAAAYLDIHRPTIKLSQWSEEGEMELLTVENERLRLVRRK